MNADRDTYEADPTRLDDADDHCLASFAEGWRLWVAFRDVSEAYDQISTLGFEYAAHCNALGDSRPSMEESRELCMSDFESAKRLRFEGKLLG